MHINKKSMRISLFLLMALVTLFANGQTAGTLTFSFTQTAHTSYTGTKNVMAVWIQSSSGAFVKTRARNAGIGTSDHLPTWATNSGGTAGNCMATACNVAGAITGATLTNFATRNFTWDGTDANGTLVADGTYKITIQSTWNHGAASTVTTSYNFTKGTTVDTQTPASDANFTNLSLQWNPTPGAAVENVKEISFTVTPNPSENGKLVIVGILPNDKISVYDLKGAVVISPKQAQGNTIELDLSNQTKATYIIKVTRGELSKEERVVLN
jgi:hypothetical protein